jgi:cytochrome P450
MLNKTPEALFNADAYQDPAAALAIMAELRKDKPVCYAEPEGIRPFWIVSRYDDIKYVESNADVFLAAPRTICLPTDAEDVYVEVFGNSNGAKTLAHMDGTEHRSHRALTQSWFLPRNLERLDGAVKELAAKFVDKMPQEGGECDVAHDIANYYPLRVAMQLLGVPEEDDPKILQWTKYFFGFTDEEYQTEGVSPAESMVDALSQFFEYFKKVTEERRANPGEDLASVLANAEIDGEPIGDMELGAYYALVATAGHDTTSACIAGGLEALIRHPDQLQKLRDNPDLMMNAVDEIIRYVSPTKHFIRTAAQDTEIAGQTIRKGEFVLLLWPSGSRDESVFENPDEFNIERPNAGKHLALGFGPHMCLGKQLARMEIAAFIGEVLRRFDNLELVEDPEYVKSYFVVCMKHLRIRYTPRTA